MLHAKPGISSINHYEVYDICVMIDMLLTLYTVSAEEDQATCAFLIFSLILCPKKKIRAQTVLGAAKLLMQQTLTQ